MNPFQLFKDLIPADAVSVCVVQAEFGDGTTAATTLDGHVIRLLGASGRQAGDKVFVRGGRIIGDAPDLDDFYFEV